MPTPARLIPVGRTPVVTALAILGLACAGARTTQVSPEEIPDLERRVQETPDDPALLLRYATALLAADRCDSAAAVARRGWSRRPHDAQGPLILGQCAEGEGRYDVALATYRDYLNRYPDRDGAPAVRARELLAARAQARERARTALAREEALETPDPRAVAVLPLEVAGDTTYQALSRGLAQMLTSDLGLLRRFPLVERLELNALLDELALAETGRVDETTAARVGRLVRAGRLVQGLLAVPPGAEVRLEASLVDATGERGAPAVTSGSIEDLLRLEKALVLILARRMGYELSEAERRLILENGTQNLVAFLAYSQGLWEEDRGNFAAAAEHYAEATRADPGFQAARDRYQATAAAPAVQQASRGDVPQIARLTVEDPGAGAEEGLTLGPTGTALATGLGDLASTLSEQTTPEGHQQTTQQASTTPISQPPPSTAGGATGTIRIIIRIP